MLFIETNILVKASAGQDTVLEEALSGEKPEWLLAGNSAAKAAKRVTQCGVSPNDLRLSLSTKLTTSLRSGLAGGSNVS